MARTRVDETRARVAARRLLSRAASHGSSRETIASITRTHDEKTYPGTPEKNGFTYPNPAIDTPLQ